MKLTTEFVIYHFKSKTEVIVNLFAWFHWPMELMKIVTDTVSAAAGGVRIKGGCVRESVIGRAANGRRQEFVSRSTFTPILVRSRFEDGTGSGRVLRV